MSTPKSALRIDPLLEYREVWQRKPVLRAVYEDIYRRILESCAPGPILEIGGGCGNFKSFAPGTITTDILPAPWLDVVGDAQRLPFADSTFANVAMVDVLHHIEYPIRALTEFARVLRDGGRLVMCEPAITPLSGVFYRMFHEEPVDMSADPLTTGEISSDKNPYDSNQAIPTLLAGRYRSEVARRLPELRLIALERFAFIAYPLSGGFQPWCLLPEWAVRPLLTVEWSLRKAIGPVAGFRMLTVHEKC